MDAFSDELRLRHGEELEMTLSSLQDAIVGFLDDRELSRMEAHLNGTEAEYSPPEVPIALIGNWMQTVESEAHRTSKNIPNDLFSAANVDTLMDNTAAEVLSRIPELKPQIEALQRDVTRACSLYDSANETGHSRATAYAEVDKSLSTAVVSPLMQLLPAAIRRKAFEVARRVEAATVQDAVLSTLAKTALGKRVAPDVNDDAIYSETLPRQARRIPPSVFNSVKSTVSPTQSQEGSDTPLNAARLDTVDSTSSAPELGWPASEFPSVISPVPIETKAQAIEHMRYLESIKEQLPVKTFEDAYYSLAYIATSLPE